MTGGSSGIGYRFATCWHIRAPVARVWDELDHPERWPSWWQGLLDVVRLCAAGPDGLGSVHRFLWKGHLPYTLAVEMRLTKSERPRMLESEASGELEGLGRWTLSEEDSGTAARYDWQVRTTKPWMNRLAPVARALFTWNHHVVMRRGERGLQRLLEDADSR